MNKDLQVLSNKLGYQFNNEQLLKQALTHKSLDVRHNERLEFLGDSIVNFIIAELLFKARVTAREGDLSRLRASLVNREALADLARGFELSSFLRMGTGELRSGGFQRSSILSDAMEAIICAIYLDSDMEVCKQVVKAWFTEKLEQIKDLESLKDPKTLLQEYMQSKKMPLPFYELIETKGKQHKQTFVVKCTIVEKNISSVGEAVSRKKAEQIAASLCLTQIKVE